MKTAIMNSRSLVLAGATATLALAAMGFAGSAHARDDLSWSVGVAAPGMSVNVGNAPQVYLPAQPVYVQPEPVYYPSRPVFVNAAPFYVQRQPVYYGRAYGWNRRHGGEYVQVSRVGYGRGYYSPRYAYASPVYYQREGRGDRGHEGRHERRHEDRHEH